MYKMNGCERLRVFIRKRGWLFWRILWYDGCGVHHARLLYDGMGRWGGRFSSTCDRKLYVFGRFMDGMRTLGRQ